MREGYCSCLVCLSVYPSVPALAASASVEISKQRYSRVSLRLFLDSYVWSFEKTFRSKVMAWKSQYANELEPLSRSFGTDETQQLHEGQLVGRMLLQRLHSYWCNRREQARYRRRPEAGLLARHSYAHAQYIHNASVCA